MINFSLKVSLNFFQTIFQQINFRPKGPALTLTVIRKNRWRKIEVDLVPCLVFKNQYLPGFRPRGAKVRITHINVE